MSTVKTYAIKEVFNTLQGEGMRTGARSVFVRFAGCNLWDGNPEHRERGKGACARWCDTDFVGGEKLTARELLDRMEALWSRGKDVRWCVLTGGEPLLQVGDELIASLSEAGWRVAVETNGTVEPPALALEMIAFITLSPKLGGKVVLSRCDELKVVLPGAVAGAEGWTEEQLLDLADMYRAASWFVQPQDPLVGAGISDTELQRQYNTKRALPAYPLFGVHLQRCIDFVMAHPGWTLSTQTHKAAGLR